MVNDGKKEKREKGNAALYAHSAQYKHYAQCTQCAQKCPVFLKVHDSHWHSGINSYTGSTRYVDIVIIMGTLGPQAHWYTQWTLPFLPLSCH